MRLGERPALPIDGRRDRSAGSRRSRADRENRRWPPGVVKTRRRPASLQRRNVAGETPSTRLASERPTQSGSRDEERVTKTTQIYRNIADSLTVPFLPARTSWRESSFPPNVDSGARLLPHGRVA